MFVKLYLFSSTKLHTGNIIQHSILVLIMHATFQFLSYMHIHYVAYDCMNHFYIAKYIAMISNAYKLLIIVF